MVEKFTDVTSSFSYTFVWKIDFTANIDQIYIEFPNDDSGLSNISFCILKKESLLKICCILRRIWNWPNEACSITYNFVCKDQIYKSISHLLDKDDIEKEITYRSELILANFDEYLKEYTTALRNTKESFIVLCELKVIKDTSAQFDVQKSINMINQTNSVVKDLQVLFENKDLCDVKLVAADKQIVEAHKAILAARSTVLKAMFIHNMKEKQNNVIEIEDVRFQVLAGFVKFIYTGKFDGLAEMADELFVIADKYDVKDLEIECEEAMINQLDVNNSIRILILADQYRSNRLKYESKKFIVLNAESVIGIADFENLEKTKIHLLKELFRELALHKEHNY